MLIVRGDSNQHFYLLQGTGGARGRHREWERNCHFVSTNTHRQPSWAPQQQFAEASTEACSLFLQVSSESLQSQLVERLSGGAAQRSQVTQVIRRHVTVAGQGSESGGVALWFQQPQVVLSVYISALMILNSGCLHLNEEDTEIIILVLPSLTVELKENLTSGQKEPSARNLRGLFVSGLNFENTCTALFSPVISRLWSILSLTWRKFFMPVFHPVQVTNSHTESSAVSPKCSF